MTIAAISPAASPEMTISQPNTTSAISTGAMARPTAMANWRESDPGGGARAGDGTASALREWAHGTKR